MSLPVIRVMLVDDHEVVVEGLEALLSGVDDIDVVATTTNSGTAVSLYKAVQPDVVLTDLSMPDLDGVELTRLLCDADSSARIVALTAFADRRLVQQAVQAGALGYLPKSVGSDDLIDGIRRATKGQAVLSGNALASMTGSAQEPVGDDLTPREREVLSALSDGHSNKQIASLLGVSPGTVRIHVSNILGKLGVSNRTAAARLAHQHGLLPNQAAER